MRENPRDVLLEDCAASTMSQRCADWFLLPKFCMTASVASKVLLHNDSITYELGLSVPHPNPVQEGQWMQQLCNGWFSQKISTEPMKRGTFNEDSVQKPLRELTFVNRIYDVWLMADSTFSAISCSSDDIALLNISHLTSPSTW